MRTTDELIELGENPSHDFNAARLRDEEEVNPATPDAGSAGTFGIPYTAFEEPQADPVSDETFASIQQFLHYFEPCGEVPGDLGLTAMMTDAFAGYTISVAAEEQGMSVEQYVIQEASATPEPSPTPNPLIDFPSFRGMLLPYQAWDSGDDRVIVVAGVTFFPVDAEFTGDELSMLAPDPERAVIRLSMTLVREGEGWLWSDTNAIVDPALIAPRI